MYRKAIRMINREHIRIRYIQRTHPHIEYIAETSMCVCHTNITIYAHTFDVVNAYTITLKSIHMFCQIPYLTTMQAKKTHI